MIVASPLASPNASIQTRRGKAVGRGRRRKEKGKEEEKKSFFFGQLEELLLLLLPSLSLPSASFLPAW